MNTIFHPLVIGLFGLLLALQGGIILRRIRMDKAQLLAALTGVSTQLVGVSDQLVDVGGQLTKATEEIVTAINNGGGTTPEIDEQVVKLQDLATSLSSIGTTLKTASQGLDDLNQDATPPAGG